MMVGVAIVNGRRYYKFDLSSRIQEFVVYNRVLTDGEMGQLNSYLSAKWGV
jgi:hypothetical protein